MGSCCVRIEKTYTPISEPSPWWLKGLAIFMAILAIIYALNALISAATPMLVSQFTDTEWDEIEEYPGDGTEEEKQEWEEGRIAWEDMQDYIDEMMIFIGWTAFHSGFWLSWVYSVHFYYGQIEKQELK